MTGDYPRGIPTPRGPQVGGHERQERSGEGLERHGNALPGFGRRSAAMAAE
jgi:hypothetical protein